MCWDSNPAKPQFGTQTHVGGTWTKLKPCLGLKTSHSLAWDLNPYDCDWSPAKTQCTWFQDLMKLRFLMSYCRKISVRDKVVGKKWIYSDSERSTFHRQSMGHQRGQVLPGNVARLVFIGSIISYANEWEDYSNYFWEGTEISRIWATTHYLIFWQCLAAFELWCWRRPSRVPWTAGRSNQSILKEISCDYSLEGLILNLNLQYFGHLMWRTDSLEKTLMLGKIEGGRRWDDRR